MFQEIKLYLHVVWHDFYIKWYMKPHLRRTVQEVLWLTGIKISILMDVISEGRFLTCVGQKSSSERSIEHAFHSAACLLPLLIQFLKKRYIGFTFLTRIHRTMQFTKKFLYYMKLCLQQKREKNKQTLYTFSDVMFLTNLKGYAYHTRHSSQ